MRISRAPGRTVQFHVTLAALGAWVLAPGCGFGLYDDGATPDVVSANDGVAGHGQWWPWACANGSYPVEASAPINYTATGNCGAGGPFALHVDGCTMEGNWDALGLTDVSTNISSSIPAAGGWEVMGTATGGAQWTCDAAAGTSGSLTFTCQAGDPAAPACTATLSPVN